MPKEIKTAFFLICFSTIASLIIATLSEADIIQAAILLVINGFVFMALFTIKFYSDKNKPNANVIHFPEQESTKSTETTKLTEPAEAETSTEQQFADEKLQLLNELNATKQELQELQNQIQNQAQKQNINNENIAPTIPPGYVHQSVLPNYEICITPQGSPSSLVSGFIKSAQRELYVAEYDLYNNRAIVEEIISAKRKSIDVRVLVDYHQNSSPNALELLNYIESFNIPVYRNTNYACMQHQFMISDGTAIQFGDCFGIDSNSANSLLVFKNAANMVEIYRNEFLRLINEPQNESVMCNDVGCPEIGIICWKNGQSGYQWQCSKYNPENDLCKSCQLLGDETHLERLQKGRVVNVADVGCDHQGEVITWINKWSNQEIGKFNQFWSCSGRDKNDEFCQRCGIKGNEDNPERVLQIRAGDKCPLCKNGVLKMRRDNYGKYVLGCGNYPACKYPETNE